MAGQQQQEEEEEEDGSVYPFGPTAAQAVDYRQELLGGRGGRYSLASYPTVQGIGRADLHTECCHAYDTVSRLVKVVILAMVST